jgi:sialidase-1
LRKRFPETEFDFIAAGIGSLGSVPHAFRLEQDVLSKGPVELLFVEAAVNDASNIPEQPLRMLRGMEGVVRHAREVNPLTDIVQMHFAMPEFLAGYRKGAVPEVIQQHEKVASAYGNASLDLAREVTERIDAGEFTWEEDFKGLHPSPFGNSLYALSMSRMLEAAWSGPVAEVRVRPLPKLPLDPQSYFGGRFGKLESVRIIRGFQRVADWVPSLPGGTRPGFVHVPALVALEPDAEIEIPFQGRGVGIFIGAGPDSAQLEVSCDGGAPKKVETFTRWSSGLYLPWALMLEDDVPPGPHVVRVKVLGEHHPKSQGTALHIFRILENGGSPAGTE